MASTPLTQPFVVLAGAPRAGKSALLNALITAPGLAPVDAAATTSAWLVFRHGERPGARAFVPGHREARPIGLDGLRVGDTAAAGRGGQSRPPRRIEVTHPAPLLARVALVDTPGIGDLDAGTADVVLDAVERAAGLVFVVDSTAPLTRTQLDFLAAAANRAPRAPAGAGFAEAKPANRALRLVFVLTKTGRHERWREVLAANRALLAGYGTPLADAAWVPVETEGAGAAGVGELRRLLAGWAEDRTEPPPPPLGGITAVTVSAGENRWQALLDREIRNRRVAATQRVSIDLATIHVRCVQELGSGQGCPELPYVLDRALHAMSVQASRQLEDDTAAVIEQVFTVLLDKPPSAPVLQRILASARRTVETLQGEEQDRDRALLITTTSAVATLTGTAAVDSLSAVGVPDSPERVLPTIAVGLTASSYQMWQPKASNGATPKLPEKKDCRRWLQQALRAVEVEVGRELARHYGDLQQALAIIAADAVDHGVLLA